MSENITKPQTAKKVVLKIVTKHEVTWQQDTSLCRIITKPAFVNTQSGFPKVTCCTEDRSQKWSRLGLANV